MTDREAMQQALDILDSEFTSVRGEFCRWCDGRMNAQHNCKLEQTISALRAALAEPVPVALKWSPAPRKTEWGECMVCADVEIDRDHTLTLYCEGGQTARVDAMFSPARRSLTDEEILKAVGWETAEMYFKLTPGFPVAEARAETLKNSRAIERAHGITGGNDE